MVCLFLFTCKGGGELVGANERMVSRVPYLNYAWCCVMLRDCCVTAA